MNKTANIEQLDKGYKVCVTDAYGKKTSAHRDLHSAMLEILEHLTPVDEHFDLTLRPRAPTD